MRAFQDAMEEFTGLMTKFVDMVASVSALQRRVVSMEASVGESRRLPVFIDRIMQQRNHVVPMLDETHALLGRLEEQWHEERAALARLVQEHGQGIPIPVVIDRVLAQPSGRPSEASALSLDALLHSLHVVERNCAIGMRSFIVESTPVLQQAPNQRQIPRQDPPASVPQHNM